MRTAAELMTSMRAFMESRTLLTAVELDVFEAVGDGATAEGVARVVGADARAMEMLLNALVSLGAMEKRDGVFRNTAVTAGWLTGPGSARTGLMHSVNLWRTWSTLTEAVKAGTSVMPPGVEDRNEEWTRAFIAAMHQRAASDAREMVRLVGAAKMQRMLDVGGGSGAYSIEFARANPELRATVLDQPHVTRLAREYIAAAGLPERVTTQDGDLRLDSFGEGYDVVLVSAICHMFGEEENRDLLRRCCRALRAGGRVVVSDFFLDADRTSPQQAVLFSLNMLVGTRSGASYTEDEYREWLMGAGCVAVERPDPQGNVLVGTRG